MRQLRERSIDAMVIDLRSVIPAPDLLIEPVAELRGGFICRLGHPLVNKSKATLKIEDVLKYPIATTNLADEVIRLLQEHFGTKISFIQAIRLRSEDISSLIEAVRERAKQLDCLRVYWQTHTTNAAGRRLYDKVAAHAGFIVYSKDPV